MDSKSDQVRFLESKSLVGEQVSGCEGPPGRDSGSPRPSLTLASLPCRESQHHLPHHGLRSGVTQASGRLSAHREHQSERGHQRPRQVPGCQRGALQLAPLLERSLMPS